jgi:hypothetical protein
MKSEKDYRGLWMIVGLVALLCIPMAIGYATHNTAPDAHAEAPAPATN